MTVSMRQTDLVAKFYDGRNFRLGHIYMYDDHTTAEVWLEATDDSGDEEDIT